MIQRCNNPRNNAYKNYGGRGIKVCDRWHEFAKFFEDMGEKPDGLTIDRKDNEGDYTPDNCRWVTRTANVNNRRNTMTLDGAPLKDWAAANGVSYGTAYRRAKLRVATSPIQAVPPIYMEQK